MLGMPILDTIWGLGGFPFKAMYSIQNTRDWSKFARDCGRSQVPKTCEIDRRLRETGPNVREITTAKTCEIDTGPD